MARLGLAIHEFVSACTSLSMLTGFDIAELMDPKAKPWDKEGVLP